jgi:hypothetical protein
MFIDVKETNFEEPNAIPVSYVINKDGKLNHKNNPLITTRLQKKILKIL